MKNQLLKTALVSNAAFSTISGLAFIIFNGQLQTWFEMDFPFWIIGAGLLPFAYLAFRVSRDKENMVNKAKIITIMDAIWVIASFVILLVMDFTTIGQWIIIGIALAVADFAIFQWLGMRKIEKAIG